MSLKSVLPKAPISAGSGLCVLLMAFKSGAFRLLDIMLTVALLEKGYLQYIRHIVNSFLSPNYSS